jgi:glutathione S-transferase
MVDLMFIPFVERMIASLAYYKGFHIRGTGMFQGVDAWFAALELRPAYLATRSDHYTHCHDLPPQLGGANARTH